MPAFKTSLVSKMDTNPSASLQQMSDRGDSSARRLFYFGVILYLQYMYSSVCVCKIEKYN